MQSLKNRAIVGEEKKNYANVKTRKRKSLRQLEQIFSSL
jgi:hypothetical protein